MLLTGLLYEDTDNIGQSLIKINLEKIQQITTNTMKGIEETLSIDH